jgi:hypothetical protein
LREERGEEGEWDELEGGGRTINQILLVFLNKISQVDNESGSQSNPGQPKPPIETILHHQGEKPSRQVITSNPGKSTETGPATSASGVKPLNGGEARHKLYIRSLVNKLKGVRAGRASSDIKDLTKPSLLTTTLFLHQRSGLNWLLWRETQTPSGNFNPCYNLFIP